MSAMVFRGIEGSNPLGFLVSAGALRLLELMWRDREIRLRWIRDDGWRAEVSGLPVEDEAGLCNLLHEKAPWAPLDVFSELGDDVTVERPLFERVVRQVVAGTTVEDRRAADFLAAFGSDVCEDKDKNKNRIQYTDLCFITGSGHQHFLGLQELWHSQPGRTTCGRPCSDRGETRTRAYPCDGIPAMPRSTRFNGTTRAGRGCIRYGGPVGSPSKRFHCSRRCRRGKGCGRRASARRIAPTSLPGRSGHNRPASTRCDHC